MGRILFVRIAAVVSGLLFASFLAFPSFPSAGFLSFFHALRAGRSHVERRSPAAFRSRGQDRDAGAVRALIA